MKKKLTASQFNKAVAHFSRLSDTNKEMARLVLVDGLNRLEAADQFGKTRQEADRWTNKIYEAYLEHHTKCPPGWIKEEICLPKSLWKEVRKMQHEALAHENSSSK